MDLERGVQIVVATPGRLVDMLQRGKLRVNSLRLLVIDEADEMLDAGFEDQVRDIFQLMPRDVQVALFSATMPDSTLQLTSRFMRDPLRVLIQAEELTLEGIQQYYVYVGREEWKLETLVDLYAAFSVCQSVIFVNTRRRAETLAMELNDRDFTVSTLHSDLDTKEREAVTREFRSGASRVLIATDVFARGIDVQGVSLVVNFDLPRKPETYIHRIGRSGRFGRKGAAINFVTDESVRSLRDVERFYSTHVKELPQDVTELI